MLSFFDQDILCRRFRFKRSDELKVIWEIDHVPVVRFRSCLVMAMVTTKTLDTG